MSRRSQWILVALLFVGGWLVAAEPALPRNKVLFIGLDGTRPDALLAAETPHLDALMADGAFTDATQILGERYQKNDTISGPGWSSLLIGVWADKHGVHDNSFRGKDYGPYPCFLQRVKEARPAAVTASVITWEPIKEHIISGADFNISTKTKTNSYALADAEAAAQAAKLLAERDIDAMFLYLGDIDETGHKKGFHPTVPEYRQAIEAADAQIGTVLAAIKSRKSYAQEDWLVLVSTDHGGKGLNHSKGHQVPEIRTTFLIVSGPSAARGKIEGATYMVDLPVTALTHLGVKIDPAWKLDGRAVGLK